MGGGGKVVSARRTLGKGEKRKFLKLTIGEDQAADACAAPHKKDPDALRKRLWMVRLESEGEGGGCTPYEGTKTTHFTPKFAVLIPLTPVVVGSTR